MLCSPQPYRQPILEAQHDLFLTCPPLSAELFKLWVSDGTAERLARRQSIETRARHELAHAILSPRTFRGQPSAYHIWVPLPPPWRTAQFVSTAREHGLIVDPGSAFAIDRAQAPHAVRVSLSAATSRERLEQGLEILTRLLDEAPARRREVI
jgi:DNA-binding transcriptional MocR family regulator